ncbi:MAG: AmmeMemoRadiSam system radical SAM enzyme [Thermodesulfobacteriota bacterium]|nr:MAG: AmmeMemoRadiSam system radical SAM enzyme [Thermodesulfobacteriota bacterium]
MKEAKLYKTLKNKIICLLCWRFCKIENNETGFCRTRINKNGKLYTLTYGNISAIESRPMEIKPFFHFKPGRTTLTFSTYSCNLTCPWCQNWHISKTEPPLIYKSVTPEEIVNLALKSGDVGLCASFNEPLLLFEFLLDTFKLAKSMGLVNTMVSNGFMTLKALKLLKEAGLDAINIDIKGNDKVYKNYCGGKAEFVWKIAQRAVEMGIHVEMVNLLITDVNDDENTISEVVENHLKYVGTKIPLHFTRYYPAYLFNKPPTEIRKLEKAIEIAKKKGIEFVYIGNVPGHRYENTYCPRCGELLIKRYSYKILENKIKNGKCPKCGKEIYGVWN